MKKQFLLLSLLFYSTILLPSKKVQKYQVVMSLTKILKGKKGNACCERIPVSPDSVISLGEILNDDGELQELRETAATEREAVFREEAARGIIASRQEGCTESEKMEGSYLAELYKIFNIPKESFPLDPSGYDRCFADIHKMSLIIHNKLSLMSEEEMKEAVQGSQLLQQLKNNSHKARHSVEALTVMSRKAAVHFYEINNFLKEINS